MIKPIQNKRGTGLVGGIIAGVAGLVVLVIVGLVIIATMLGAGILTSGGTSETSATNMKLNLTSGIDNVSAKLPTILLIAAVVILFGAIAVLVARSRGMTGGGTL